MRALRVLHLLFCVLYLGGAAKKRKKQPTAAWRPMSMTRRYAHGQCGRGRVISSQDVFRTASWRKRVLVHPPSKLAFCKVAKVANSQFAKLFNDLNGFHNNHSDCCGYTPREGSQEICYYDSVSSRFNFTAPTYPPDWTLVAFVRDPLERLLSTVINTCHPTKRCEFNYTRFACCLDGIRHGTYDDPRSIVHFQDRVRAFEMFMHVALNLKVNRRIIRKDWHFESQEESIFRQCNFPMHRTQLFKLSSDRNMVHEEVKKMLLPSYRGSKELVSSYIEQHFPRAGYSDALAARHAEKAGQQLRTYFRTRATIDAALRFVGIDYQLLSIPFPSWVSSVK
eukprot:TRINITY_DN14468_c0_g1_i6.p1 TRINITY_DN14468_c0_g1~~TRINITY_DN14468_c0_g1_i6.p1  ORF type:complete len:337 (-),score=27.90 TRINITY_DN14468_c0_g1_i6:282-1292(-)